MKFVGDRRASVGQTLSFCFCASVLLGGCAPTIWQRASDPAAVASTLSRLAPIPPQPRNRERRPLAFLALAGEKGSRLAAIALTEKHVLWVVPAKISGRIASGTSILVHADGPNLVGRDLADGHERWRAAIPAGQTLMGYALDDDAVFYVVRSGGDGLRGGDSELVSLEGRGGSVRWRRRLGTAAVAAPAAGSGVVLVPNRSQFVSLVDAATGAPLGEVLSREQAANFVVVAPPGFAYGFGTDGIFRLSAETAVGVRGSPDYLRAALPPFVRVNYERDMYRPELLDYSALDRHRVLWRLDARGGPRGQAASTHFQDDAVVALDYRFFFGFDPVAGALRWAYSLPVAEAVSAIHLGNLVVFVTADGEIAALDPRTGARRYDFRLAGEVVRGATFDSEGFTGAGAGAGYGDGEEGPAPALSTVLPAMVHDPDRRFVDLQAFAIDQMRYVPGPQITAELLRLMADEDVAPAARQKAGQVLIARHALQAGDAASLELIVDAIRVHADRVARTRPAGLATLAAAAGAMKAEVAALPLAEHLALPETDPTTAAAILRALVAIGSNAVVPELRDYLCQYRADETLAGDAVALRTAVDALVSLGTAPDRELLVFVAEAPSTLSSVRDHIRRSLGGRFTQP